MKRLPTYHPASLTTTFGVSSLLYIITTVAVIIVRTQGFSEFFHKNHQFFEGNLQKNQPLVTTSSHHCRRGKQSQRNT